MDPREALRRELAETFAVEAAEHIDRLRVLLRAATDGRPDPAVVEETFRVMHTLKGAARSVGMKAVEIACHACEGLLQAMASGRVPPSAARIALLGRAVEAIAELHRGPDPAPSIEPLLDAVRRAEHDEPEDAPPPVAAAAPVRRDTAAPTRLRVAAERLDALIGDAEGLHQPAQALTERWREATALLSGVRELRAQAARARRGHEAARDSETSLETLEAAARRLMRALATDRRAISGGVDALLGGARRLRMTPVAAMLGAFPDMVRDLARAEGREVAWRVAGGDAEVDRRIIEAVKDPLIHLIRNAVAHGAEPPEERRAAGKAPAMTISLAVTGRDDGYLEMVLEDDGRGLDPEAVHRRAVELELLPEGDGAAPDNILDVVWTSGFSTSPLISDLAGRGLGLAIVKDRVESLGGRLALASRPGRGTRVILVVPATVSLLRALLIRVQGRALLLPADAVERVVRIDRAGLKRSGRHRVMAWAEGEIPVADLAAVLEMPAAGASGPMPCAVVGVGESRVGLLVDAVSGIEIVLPRPLGAPLDRVRNVAGAAVLGTGELALILRASDLLRSVEAGRVVVRDAPEDPGETGPEVVLVVDDSVTTRIMEKNLLEAAGYQVHLAKDGLDATEVLQRERIDIVVSDVDMPRMDGFELTAHIRGDPRLSALPVILVTALESAEDKKRGIEVGASAYIVKSQFDESRLLDIVRRVV